MNDMQRRDLWAQHNALAVAAHDRGDIPEANYHYGWVDALAAIEFSVPDEISADRKRP